MWLKNYNKAFVNLDHVRIIDSGGSYDEFDYGVYAFLHDDVDDDRRIDLSSHYFCIVSGEVSNFADRFDASPWLKAVINAIEFAANEGKNVVLFDEIEKIYKKIDDADMK